MITIQALMACGIGYAQAVLFATPLQDAAERFLINTPSRLAGFISQCDHESWSFTRLEENLNYTTAQRIVEVFPRRVPSVADAARLVRDPMALANRVYANRNGNADESSGDGWKYRGRGLIQLTGRANYMAAGDKLGAPLKDTPDLVAKPEFASLTAAQFWAAAGCNAAADAMNVDAMTRAINGPAMAGLEDRRQRFQRAMAAFS